MTLEFVSGYDNYVDKQQNLFCCKVMQLGPSSLDQQFRSRYQLVVEVQQLVQLQLKFGLLSNFSFSLCYTYSSLGNFKKINTKKGYNVFQINDIFVNKKILSVEMEESALLLIYSGIEFVLPMFPSIIIKTCTKREFKYIMWINY